MSKIIEASQILVDECANYDENIEIVFSHNEITIYWKSLRIDCNPKNFKKALTAIKQLEVLGARFE